MIKLCSPLYARCRVPALPGFFLATLMLAFLSVAAEAQSSSSGAGPQVGPTVGAPAGQTNAPGTAPMKPGVLNAKLPQSGGPAYNDKYEIYGGLSFMNGQAGQVLPKRYNMGGGEVMGVYWLRPTTAPGLLSHLGVAADYRLELGTTPVFPNNYYNRVLVYQNIISGGVEYRGPRNRYAAIDYHALAGITRGTFDHAVQNYPGGSPLAACPQQQTFGQQGNLGLYCNSTSGWGAAGGSIDFNYAPKIGIRLSPDMIFEHFGTETREFFSISGGVMYRFGQRK